MALEVLEERAGGTLHVALAVVQDLVSFDCVAARADIWLATRTSLARVVAFESQGHPFLNLIDLRTTIV